MRAIATHFLRWAAPVLLAAVFVAEARPAAGAALADAQRIVVVGGSLTEIVFELGFGGRVVGVDQTSAWPEQAKELPKVGYMRALAVEGVVSLAPDLVLTFDDVEPRSALDQLRAAGIAVTELPRTPSIDVLLANIETLADGFGVPERGAALAGRIQDELAAVREAVERRDRRLRAVFFLNVGQGPMLVSGRGTVADLVMALAGADNVAGRFDSYKPLSPEALLTADPDVLLTTEHGLAAIGGAEGFGRLPGVGATTAFRAGRIVTLDANLLLGIGPRIGMAARLLAERLHGIRIAEAGR